MKILKTFAALLSLILFFPTAKGLAGEMKLQTFVTDNCTMFADGTPARPGIWKHCCVEHDLRYWFGGSEKDMDKTDSRLKECVDKVAGSVWANMIYNGVRAGHYSPIKNKYHWGWAWTVKRDKSDLTPEEKIYVLSELKLLKIPEVNMDEFIKFYFP